MSNLDEKLLDAALEGAQSTIKTDVISKSQSQGFMRDALQLVFVRGEQKTEDVMLLGDAINDDSIIPLIVAGRAWVNAQVVERGIDRSALDPSQIIDEFVVVTSVTPVEGIVGNDEATDNTLLSNILIGSIAMAGAGIALAKYFDFSITEFLGIDTGDTQWSEIATSSERGVLDPITGEPIVGLAGVASSINIQDLKNIEDRGPQKGEILIGTETSDATGGCGEMIFKSFNQALIDADIDVTGATVEDNESEVATDVKILNFGTNLTVIDDGSNQITVNSAAGVGEANTGSNVGTGAEVFKDKVAIDLRHRTLIAGDGIKVIENINDIEISALADPGDPGEDELGPVCVPITCNGTSGPACGPPIMAPPDLAFTFPLLDFAVPETQTIDALNTNSIKVHFHFEGLFLAKTNSPSNTVADNPFPCVFPFPLDAQESSSLANCLTAGTINIQIEIVTNPCDGDDVVIHCETVTYTGYNSGSFSKNHDIAWASIDSVECLKRFPETLINSTTNVRFRFTRQDDASSTDVYFAGFTPTNGDNWKHGGDNKSRDDAITPSSLVPPAEPSISIADDGIEPVIAPA